ncbi:hypothetical protein BU23DRAFT_602328 [Bimuria novae-zelandiae CBS 107.79]|uniref:Uncharacterized protein n=1 Tax=Bimuria novae-zelandiae CBS 107.79 TaxID=1447943 RepID=A0A6A5UTY0_9PLEO|nr:hypothetical protein BU23DRAFT_602328 [Bimuria novae-zelandiae CBS 107.79]
MHWQTSPNATVGRRYFCSTQRRYVSAESLLYWALYSEFALHLLHGLTSQALDAVTLTFTLTSTRDTHLRKRSCSPCDTTNLTSPLEAGPPHLTSPHLTLLLIAPSALCSCYPENVVLLDLPPETLQRIIQAYVARVGVGKTWKKREVCKTFNTFLTEEIFAHQSITAYTRGRGKALFRNGLVAFLEYRITNSRGALDFLPAILRKAVDEIMKITGETSDDARTSYFKKAATVTQKNCKDPFNSLVNSGKRAARLSAKDTHDGLLLCLISGMGNTTLAEEVLKYCPDVWHSTYCFGSPMEVVINAKDLAMVELFLKKASQPSEKRKAISMIANIIFHKLRRQFVPGSSEFLGRLISLHSAILGRPRAEHCAYWFFEARFEKNYDIMATVLDLGATQILAAKYREQWMASSHWDVSFKAWLQYPACDLDTLKHLLRNCIFDVEKLYVIKSRCDNIPDMEKESILNYTVRSGRVDLVHAVLEAGANPNGILQPNGRREYLICYRPMRRSAQGFSIVKHLLASGADLAGGDTPGSRPQDYASRGSDVYKLLKKATDKLATKNDPKNKRVSVRKTK